MTDASEKPALAAALRAAGRTLDGLDEEAKQALFEANRHGRLGSSSYPEHLSQLLQKGFRQAADEAATVFAGLKDRRALAHVDQFRGSLNDLRMRVISTFDRYDGTGTLYSKPGAVRAALEQKLVEISDGVRADLSAGVYFLKVGFTPPPEEHPTETRVSEQPTKMAILTCLTRGRSHKMTLLGRPGQPGLLEAELGFQFNDSNERSTAGRYFAELQADGLIAPTYTDIVDPENWLTITDAGMEALRTGALDALDAALLAINPALVDMRRGARSAALSSRADAARQAAHSGRELLNQVLHSVSPDASVKSQPGFGEQTPVTRKARLRYALAARNGRASESDVDVIEAFADLGDALYKKLSAEAHVRGTARDVGDFLRSVDIILERLLLS